MRVSFILLIFLFFSSPAGSQELSSRSKIYLLSCSSGDELYSTFGHTGIRVFDPENKMDIVFNYGLFDFDTDGFYIKFLRGQLLYKLGVQRMDSFIQSYKREKRSVYQQELQLDSIQRSQLFGFLSENYLPEYRSYKYDFFFDNCATRPRDAFESVLNIQYQSEESSLSFRNILDQYLSGMPWSDFGIDLVIGSVADRTADLREQMFIPDYLHDHVAKAHIANKAFVAKEDLLLDFISLSEERKIKPWFNPLLFFSFLLLIEILLIVMVSKERGKVWYERYNKLFLIILGLSGCLLTFMWFGTEHQATKNNWNLLWLHPLYLALLIGFRHKKWLLYLCTLLIVTTMIGYRIIPQQLHIAILPILGIILIKLYYLLFLEKKRGNRTLAGV